jgi:hypothetical protein
MDEDRTVWQAVDHRGQEIAIFRLPNGNFEFWAGNVSECRVSSVELTREQLKDLFNTLAGELSEGPCGEKIHSSDLLTARGIPYPQYYADDHYVHCTLTGPHQQHENKDIGLRWSSTRR